MSTPRRTPSQPPEPVLASVSDIRPPANPDPDPIELLMKAVHSVEVQEALAAHIDRLQAELYNPPPENPEQLRAVAPIFSLASTQPPRGKSTKRKRPSALDIDEEPPKPLPAPASAPKLLGDGRTLDNDPHLMPSQFGVGSKNQIVIADLPASVIPSDIGRLFLNLPAMFEHLKPSSITKSHIVIRDPPNPNFKNARVPEPRRSKPLHRLIFRGETEEENAASLEVILRAAAEVAFGNRRDFGFRCSRGQFWDGWDYDSEVVVKSEDDYKLPEILACPLPSSNVETEEGGPSSPAPSPWQWGSSKPSKDHEGSEGNAGPSAASGSNFIPAAATPSVAADASVETDAPVEKSLCVLSIPPPSPHTDSPLTAVLRLVLTDPNLSAPVPRAVRVKVSHGSADVALRYDTEEHLSKANEVFRNRVRGTRSNQRFRVEIVSGKLGWEWNGAEEWVWDEAEGIDQDFIYAALPHNKRKEVWTRYFQGLKPPGRDRDERPSVDSQVKDEDVEPSFDPPLFRRPSPDRGADPITPEARPPWDIVWDLLPKDEKALPNHPLTIFNVPRDPKPSRHEWIGLFTRPELPKPSHITTFGHPTSYNLDRVYVQFENPIQAFYACEAINRKLRFRPRSRVLKCEIMVDEPYVVWEGCEGIDITDSDAGSDLGGELGGEVDRGQTSDNRDSLFSEDEEESEFNGGDSRSGTESERASRDDDDETDAGPTASTSRTTHQDTVSPSPRANPTFRQRSFSPIPNEVDDPENDQGEQPGPPIRAERQREKQAEASRKAAETQERNKKRKKARTKVDEETRERNKRRKEEDEERKAERSVRKKFGKRTKDVEEVDRVRGEMEKEKQRNRVRGKKRSNVIAEVDLMDEEEAYQPLTTRSKRKVGGQ